MANFYATRLPKLACMRMVQGSPKPVPRLYLRPNGRDVRLLEKSATGQGPCHTLSNFLPFAVAAFIFTIPTPNDIPFQFVRKMIIEVLIPDVKLCWSRC